jgi:2-polyprenyl-3-methyl-5-hydroxy-6-metoxy-1,4-benzoquinol methylase
MILNYLLKPCRFDDLHSFLNKKAVKILDVGCGNHSPSITKKYYPDCIYYGLDRSKDYNLDKADLESMKDFFQADLTKIETLNAVPNEFFDCIILSHVVEHLSNGEEVIAELLKKLRKGGVFYLETPSSQSVNFPKMKGPLLGGCLNFYDDPTHMQKPCEEKSLIAVFENNGCRIQSAGIRRSFKRIFFFPVYFAGSFVRFGYLDGCVFWDILGFVEQIIAVKE